MRIGWDTVLICLFGAGCYAMAFGAFTGRMPFVLAGMAFGLAASAALALSGPRR